MKQRISKAAFMSFITPRGDNGSEVPSDLFSKQLHADAIWDASVDDDVFIIFLPVYR